MLLYLRQFGDNPPALFAFVAAFAVAYMTGIAFHEFSHAWAANQLGDDTAARQGRLTLNPLAHLDVYGTILMALVGIGWGKPTPVNPYRLRYGPKTGNAIVAGAGPLSNFVFATLAAIPIRLGMVSTVGSFSHIRDATGGEIVGLFLVFIVLFNVLLGVFNLLPIHPLDGFKVLLGLLPTEMAAPLERLAPWGPGILMTLFVAGFILPVSPISFLIGGISDRILQFLLA